MTALVVEGVQGSSGGVHATKSRYLKSWHARGLTRLLGSKVQVHLDRKGQTMTDIVFPSGIKSTPCHLETHNDVHPTRHGAYRHTWQELAHNVTVATPDYRGHVQPAQFGDELDRPCSSQCVNVVPF